MSAPPWMRLPPLLAAALLAAGCGGSPPELGAGGLQLHRTGASRDLTCLLAREAQGAVPRRVPAQWPRCGCPGSRDEACWHVDHDDDRRRAVVLSPGTTVTVSAPVSGAASLRFAATAIGRPGATVELVVAVAGGDADGAREWRRTLPVGAPWTDGSLELGSAEAGDASVTVRVGDAPGATLALATPRLVEPVRAGSGVSPSNVIVYLIDTLRRDHVSLYGYERPTMPELERLARRAVVFDNAYSTAAWTRPATASLLTSLHSRRHGAHSNRPLSRDVVTLAERFRDAGWSTWAFVANGNVFDQTLNFDQGFDRFVAIRGERRDNHARTAEVNALVLPQLEAFGDEPFLLFVHTVDPHSPYDPPSDYRGTFTDPSYAGPVAPEKTTWRNLYKVVKSPADVRQVQGLYDEDVRYQDAMLGVLLDRLDQLGLLETTVVVVTADHGEEFFDHGSWEHGGRLFQEQIRIPLVVSFPGRPELAGRRISDPVQLIDVMPTVMAAYGLTGLDTCAGRDLGPLLVRGAPAPAAGSPLYFEEVRDEKGFEVVGLIDPPWKIIRRTEASGRERQRLYNLERDPREGADLARRDAQHLARLQHELNAYARASEPPADAADAVPAKLDERTRRQLQAMGYVADDE